LKKQFDRVVYKKQNNISTANAAPIEETRPVIAATAPTTPVAVQANSAEGEKFYTVKKGDTGFSIAKRNGITVKQLTEWNNLNFGAIKEGQKLRVKQ
jgi:membrane-bound lytic murein transglycosylase D